MFLSVHGGGTQVDPVSGKSQDLGVTLCYVVPTIHKGSLIAYSLCYTCEYQCVCRYISIHYVCVYHLNAYVFL